MNIADKALANAIPLEVKKDGLAQRQDGSWTLRLRVHPQDAVEKIAAAPMGQRYMLAMVELNDDETPKERRKWNELTPTTQAAIRCEEPGFQRFLNASDASGAADEVRKRCEVQSRTELSTNARASAAWERLDSEYQTSGYR